MLLVVVLSYRVVIGKTQASESKRKNFSKQAPIFKRRLLTRLDSVRRSLVHWPVNAKKKKKKKKETRKIVAISAALNNDRLQQRSRRPQHLLRGRSRLSSAVLASSRHFVQGLHARRLEDLWRPLRGQ